MRARETVAVSAWPAAMRFAMAARYLECSETEVRDLVNSGELPTIQYSERGHRRIRREAMDAWLLTREECRVNA